MSSIQSISKRIRILNQNWQEALRRARKKQEKLFTRLQTTIDQRRLEKLRDSIKNDIYEK